jgi:Zn finger protein HypA/HybF involved in hydrogenase expression
LRDIGLELPTVCPKCGSKVTGWENGQISVYRKIDNAWHFQVVRSLYCWYYKSTIVNDLNLASNVYCDWREDFVLKEEVQVEETLVPKIDLTKEDIKVNYDPHECVRCKKFFTPDFEIQRYCESCKVNAD